MLEIASPWSFFAVILIIYVETVTVLHGRQGWRAHCAPRGWGQRVPTPALRPVISNVVLMTYFNSCLPPICQTPLFLLPQPLRSFQAMLPTVPLPVWVSQGFSQKGDILEGRQSQDESPETLQSPQSCPSATPSPTVSSYLMPWLKSKGFIQTTDPCWVSPCRLLPQLSQKRGPPRLLTQITPNWAMCKCTEGVLGCERGGWGWKTAQEGRHHCCSPRCPQIASPRSSWS